VDFIDATRSSPIQSLDHTTLTSYPLPMQISSIWLLREELLDLEIERERANGQRVQGRLLPPSPFIALLLRTKIPLG
jgi:hypothetical protein